jgi:surface polysaccharide O-acyltransferase-like enzyme
LRISGDALSYVHNLRAIAILFVIAIHCISSLNWEESSGLHKVVLIITHNGVELFIFIAGFLFQRLSAKFQYKSYLQKRLKTVVFPYLLVSIPGIVYALLKGPFPGFRETVLVWQYLRDCLMYYLTGAHVVPYWFIPMILLYFLATPLFIVLDRWNGTYCLLPFGMLISIIILPEFGEVVNPVRMFLHYLSFYLLGMIFSRYKVYRLELLNDHRSWLLLALVITIIVEIVISPQWKFINVIQSQLLCSLLIYWLWKYDSKLPSYIIKTFNVIADYSFGIYLLHYYLILFWDAFLKKGIMLNQIPLRPLPDGTLLNFIFTFISITMLSVMCVYLIKKIVGRRSKMLIGC